MISGGVSSTSAVFDFESHEQNRIVNIKKKIERINCIMLRDCEQIKYCCEFTFCGRLLKKQLPASMGGEMRAGNVTAVSICRERISPNRSAKISFVKGFYG